MFKSRIIKTALDDIKRVCDAGQIDFYFDIKEVRPRGKKTGEPSYIEFVKVAEKKKAKQEHRKASEKRLCKKLCELYPTLDEERLKYFISEVTEDLWNDFKTYAYNGVPKAVEQPHRWNGTMEDFVFYIMEQWIKQHSTNPEPQQQMFDFAEADEVKPGEKDWQMFLSLLDKTLASDLSKVTYLSFDDGAVCLGVKSKAQVEMIEEHFVDTAVLDHTQKCAVKIFGKKISLKYKIVKQ